MAGTLLIFVAGMLTGLLAEYLLHLAFHKLYFGTHKEHHRDFFVLEPKAVARKSHPLLEYGLYAVIVFLLLAPMVFLIGWVNYLIFYAGLFTHLMLVYQAVHYLFHADTELPAFIRNNKWYRWWRLCHIEHHWHSPKRNFSVTCPLLDMVFGTFVPPGTSYRPTPVPNANKLKRPRKRSENE